MEGHSDLAAHGLELLLIGRCRRCAEVLPGGAALRGQPCATCGEGTTPTDDERAELSRRFHERGSTRMWIAVGAVAAATMAAGWMPLVTALLLAASLIYIRVALVSPATRLFSAPRRMVSHWTLRLAGACYFSLAVIFVELLTLVPFLGLIGKTLLVSVQVSFAAWFAHLYLGWQGRREAAGEPVEAWEYVIVGVWMFLIIVVMVAMALALAWILGKLSALLQWLS